jgi:hypothetical protein
LADRARVDVALGHDELGLPLDATRGAFQVESHVRARIREHGGRQFRVIREPDAALLRGDRNGAGVHGERRVRVGTGDAAPTNVGLGHQDLRLGRQAGDRFLQPHGQAVALGLQHRLLRQVAMPPAMNMAGTTHAKVWFRAYHWSMEKASMIAS